jgi:transcriptional regulator with XRE-family HTH domain
MTDSIPYRLLASLIIQGRKAVNLNQRDLAGVLGIKQQSVSRWEAGTHRPDVGQIPAIATAIRADIDELMALAGYGVPVTITAPPPFPVDALAPFSFEQFTADLIELKHPEATIRLQGATGHMQDGADVIASFDDGRIWAFQCKRVERFGPADAEKVIGSLRIDAERAFLVLSRTASPQTAEAVRRHPRWSLWDKQDINRHVRTLPVEAQDRIVDLYFPGQRMALLGRSEPGPWVTADQYFAPFRTRAAVFSHDWAMVGRETEIARLADELADAGSKPVVLVTGPGGIGKTRIVKEGTALFERKHKRTAVRFLSAARDPDRASLDALGRGNKVLVIDDAHDREGLGVLIEYAADPRNRTQLLIVTRPYAEQRIRNELGIFNIVDPPTLALDRLDRAELHALVAQVLAEFGGESEWAESVVEIAGDSPLVAAMAARVVARDGVPTELARREKGLRQIILSRFTNVITGNLGAPSDAPLLRAVMEVLAVIQPFHIDDRGIAELVAKTRSDFAPGEITRAMKMLLDGGVIYKRGHLHRLMPDLLGDFLIEESCIGADGRLTPFAEQVASDVKDQQLVQVLVNLGRMDWRRADGDPSHSDLLEPIWVKLRAIDSEYDGRIEAVEAVAIYQPAQSLRFVEAQIERDRILSQFPTILRRVALSPEHRREALRLLWDLGRDDARDLSPHPNHAIRVLAELVGYEEHKSFEFNKDLSEFAFGLLDEPGAWDSVYSPLDILEPLLSGQGLTTSSTARAISLSPFFVDHKVVGSLRERLIDRAIALLFDPHPRTARRAAIFLNNALREPHEMMTSVAPDDLRADYRAEIAATIAKLGGAVRGGKLAAPTLIGLVRSMGWHAEFDEGVLGDAVREIFDDLPADLGFRLHACLADGADWSFLGQIPFAEWEEDKEWHAEAVAALHAAYPDSDALIDAIAARLAALDAAGEATGNCGPFIDKLISAKPAFGDAIVANVISDPKSRMRHFLGFAAGAVLDKRPEEGRALITTLLDANDQLLRTSGAAALMGLRREREPQDVALLRRAIGVDDARVASTAIMALRTWRDVGAREVIELAMTVRFDIEPQLFEPFTMLLCSQRKALLERLSDRDVRQMLKRMRTLPRVEGHWAEEILQHLAGRHAEQLAGFLFDRADLALGEDRSQDFAVLGHSRRRGQIGFHESPAVRAILARAWTWLRAHDEDAGWAHYRRAEIFARMFKVDSEPVVEFFDALLARATAEDLRWIARIVRQGHHSLVFTYRAFVLRYFERCKAAGRELVKFGLDQFSAAALSGGWSGTPGEPMPRDLKARDAAQSVIDGMSRMSPAYPLYREILEHAKRNIERSIREGQAMDEEE